MRSTWPSCWTAMSLGMVGSIRSYRRSGFQAYEAGVATVRRDEREHLRRPGVLRRLRTARTFGARACRGPEWSSVRALLPDLVGAHVVDLGSGFGAFARWAAAAGATNVLALDSSVRM